MTMTKEMSAILRAEFDPSHISKFPPNSGAKAGLSYVGHAAVTNRILDADPCATWDFFPVDASGAPVFDGLNGIWVRMTIGGVTRSEYGAEPCTIEEGTPKKGGSYSRKEAMEAQVIARQSAMASAFNRAAMRFGVALNLWHKGGDLYQEPAAPPQIITPEQAQELRDELAAGGSDEGKFVSYVGRTLKIDGIDSIPVSAFADVMAIAKKATATKAAKSAKDGE